MHDIKNTFYVMKLVYKACPKRAILSVIKNTLGSCRWAIYNVVFLRILLNALSTQADSRQIYILLGVFAFVFVSLEILFVYYKKTVVASTDPLLTQNVNVMIYEKAAAMDMASYENPEFYERYYRAMSGARVNVVSTFDRMSILFAMISSVLIIAFTTAYLDKWVFLFLIVPLIASFTVGEIIKKVRYQSDMANMEENRKIGYVKRVAYYKEYADELRTSGIFDVHMRDYNRASDAKMENTKQYGTRISLLSSLNDSLNYLFLTFGVILYLLIRIKVHKTIIVGDFVVTINSIGILAMNLRGISRQIMAFSENSMYIDNFNDFMNATPKVVSTGNHKVDMNTEHTFRFENVSFSYDGRKQALRNVSLEISQNQKLAIVGYNGAGKTTLIKLLLRFYDPDEGRILLNGIDIREYDLDSYRAMFGVCFQDFMIMAMTLSENVLMRHCSPADNQRVDDALQFSGLEAFSDKKERVLTKEFDPDGLVLSEGQKQRLSIARAYAKDTPLLILDEPTSALDPLAENNLYQRMDTMGGSKTVIFITHHLGSCMSADRILYLAEGELAEEGTFDSLMQKGGLFYQIFTKQKEGYADEASK